MNGWEKVIASAVLAVIGLAGLNLAVWRRLKQAQPRACLSADADIHKPDVYPENDGAGSEMG